MNDRVVRKWIRQFNEGTVNGEKLSKPSIVNEYLVTSMDQKMNRLITMAMLAVVFHKFL